MSSFTTEKKKTSLRSLKTDVFTSCHKKLKSGFCYTEESQALKYFAVLMSLSVEDGR